MLTGKLAGRRFFSRLITQRSLVCLANGLWWLFDLIKFVVLYCIVDYFAGNENGLSRATMIQDIIWIMI